MPPSSPQGQQNQFFGQKVSKPGINVNSAGDNELIYKNDFSTTLYYNSSGVPTVLLGLRPLNNDQGLYVSKDGIDVTQATDSQLIFNSSQDVFKIVQTGTSIIPSVTVTSGSSQITGVIIPHNLGFAPICNVFVNLETSFVINGSLTLVNSFVELPIENTTDIFYNIVSSGSGNVAQIHIWTATDEVNLYIGALFHSQTGSFVTLNIPVKYYLLQETAS